MPVKVEGSQLRPRDQSVLLQRIPDKTVQLNPGQVSIRVEAADATALLSSTITNVTLGVHFVSAHVFLIF